jgi:sugar O-acyltransferase (sialic acid O-acetyltransferase NeuD family)
MKDLIIYGAGDVGKFIAYNLDLFEERWRFLAMVDDDPAKDGSRVCGVEVWSRERLFDRPLEDVCVAIAICDPAAKRRIADDLSSRGVRFPALIARGSGGEGGGHRSGCSWISHGVTLGRGVIIYPGNTVEHETVIGDFATINAGCTVGHNVRIGSFATLSPGVHLAGRTTVGEGAFLGIGSCTRQGVSLGAGCVVGGQAMVTHDVEAGKTVVGVPAKTT